MICNIPQADRSKYMDGTCCLYDGQPYYIRCIVDDPKVYLYDFNTHRTKMKTIEYNDPLFDVATPPLGYVQIENRVVYLSRRPHRRWKQGIDRESVFANFIGVEFQWGFWGEPLRRTMAREFIPLKTILDLLRADETYAEWAVSNDCCLVNQGEIIKVWFRGEEVGFIPRAGLKKERPTVLVPSSQKAWIVSRYLELYFDWK